LRFQVTLGANAGSSYHDAFDWYDRDRTGVIDLPRFHNVLADLGLLEGK
jgi:Ca2+-binding EF-hand superfamily protein